MKATPKLLHRAFLGFQKLNKMEIASRSPIEWKKRSVVSSFIFKFDDTGVGSARVALFRRSGRVSTYQ